MYEYEQVMKCVEALGPENTFSPDMLETLLAYSDNPDEKVLYGLIVLFGEKAFTDEAKEFLSNN